MSAGPATHHSATLEYATHSRTPLLIEDDHLSTASLQVKSNLPFPTQILPVTHPARWV